MYILSNEEGFLFMVAEKKSSIRSQTVQNKVEFFFCFSKP